VRSIHANVFESIGSPVYESREPGVAQQSVDRRRRRDIVDAERVEGVEETAGVEPARVRTDGDTERQWRDGPVPEAVSPRRRRWAEVPVAGLEADAVERGDHQRHY